MIKPTELERAMQLSRLILPRHDPDRACFLVQSIIAGMRGLTLKHIRVGALFWPDKVKDHPYLSMRGGWGLNGYSEANKTCFLAEQDVDDDGGFNGHTWLEPPDDDYEVLDLMHDNNGSLREVYNMKFEVIARYIPRKTLEMNVKRYWRKEMRAAIQLGAINA